MKLTRRKLALAVLAPAAAAAPQNRPENEELLKSARTRNQANFAAVAQVKLPVETEPSFQFKA
jgi:hypothetical protein